MFILRILLVTMISCVLEIAPVMADAEKSAPNDRSELIWENPAVRRTPKELDIEIRQAYIAIQAYNMIVHTPLKRLDRISRLTGKEVYLKDEAGQISGSFKMRGVSYEVYWAIRSYLRKIDELGAAALQELKGPFYIVTQSDGNHGIAMIEAVARGVEVCLSEYPEWAALIKNIEPVVFTIRRLPEIKRAKMEKALDRYRGIRGDITKGAIYGDYESYSAAKEARIKFVEKHGDSAVYMEHGGFNMMCGQGSLGIEIDQDLNNLGIGNDKKVTVIVPVGAGSLVGMVAGIKICRPNSAGVIVQTKPYSAFVRSLINNSFESNQPNPGPTAVIQGKPIVFEDGIAVDSPEKGALNVSKKIMDCALIVDPGKNLSSAAPLLYKDLTVYPDPVVGGTTSATLEALLEYPDIKAIKDADLIVLIGAEENVDLMVTEYIEALSERLD